MKRIQDSAADCAYQQQLFREFVFAGRFGMVGLAATGIHMLAVWLLIEQTGLPLLLANLLAFLLAFGISFGGNYFWTFGSTGCPKRAFRRFFLIASAAFATNTLVLSLLLRFERLEPASAALVAATSVPGFTYVASRIWGFQVGSRTN